MKTDGTTLGFRWAARMIPARRIAGDFYLSPGDLGGLDLLRVAAAGPGPAGVCCP